MLYVCLITAPGQVIEDVQALDLPADGAACDHAMTLARHRSPWHGYELWLGGRKIAAFYPPSMVPTLRAPAAHQRRAGKARPSAGKCA